MEDDIYEKLEKAKPTLGAVARLLEKVASNPHEPQTVLCGGCDVEAVKKAASAAILIAFGREPS